MVSKTIDTSDNSWINLLKKKKTFAVLPVEDRQEP